MVSIYALKNPINDEIFYVGASMWPENRFQTHRYGGVWPKNSYRYKTVRDLWLKKISPELIILTKVEQKMAKQAEQFWINYYTHLGHPITQLKTSAYPKEHSDGFIWKLKYREEVKERRRAIF